MLSILYLSCTALNMTFIKGCHWVVAVPNVCLQYAGLMSICRSSKPLESGWGLGARFVGFAYGNSFYKLRDSNMDSNIFLSVLQGTPKKVPLFLARLKP